MKEKKLVVGSYLGVFLRGGKLPLAICQYESEAEYLKKYYINHYLSSPYEHVRENASRVMIKRCRMGRLLTQRVPDAGDSGENN